MEIPRPLRHSQKIIYERTDTGTKTGYLTSLHNGCVAPTHIEPEPSHSHFQKTRPPWGRKKSGLTHWCHRYYKDLFRKCILQNVISISTVVFLKQQPCFNDCCLHSQLSIGEWPPKRFWQGLTFV